MSGGNCKGLFNAGCAGDLVLVEYHLKCGLDVNCAHHESLTTPLAGAILAKQKAEALYSLDYGAIPDSPSELDDEKTAASAVSTPCNCADASTGARFEVPDSYGGPACSSQLPASATRCYSGQPPAA